MDNIGNKLKRERELRNISLDQLAEATRIQKKFLQALEEGRYELLSSPVFVVGFIRSYASYLGMDANPLVAEYEAARQALKPEIPPPRVVYRRKPKIAKAPVVAGFAVVLVVVVAAVGFFRSAPALKHEAAPAVEEDLVVPSSPTSAQDGKKAEPSPEEMLARAVMPPTMDFRASEEQAKTPKTAVPVEEKLPPAPTQKAEPEKSKAVAQPEKAAQSIQSSPKAYSNIVVLSAKGEDVWIYAVIDDNDVRDMYIRAGKSVVIRGNKSFSLTTGNALHLEIKANGKQVRIPGAEGNKIVRNWQLPLEK